MNTSTVSQRTAREQGLENTPMVSPRRAMSEEQPVGFSLACSLLAVSAYPAGGLPSYIRIASLVPAAAAAVSC